MEPVRFYHLTRDPVDAALPKLLDKARGAGMRVAVRARSAQMVERLDDLLWTTAPAASFLPHGRADDGFGPDHPVLLTTAQDLPNRPDYLIAIEGAEIDLHQIAQMPRAAIMFEAADQAQMDQARAQWKAVTGAGMAAEYWFQDAGRWTKKDL